MSNFIDDFIGTPRKRSKVSFKSPLGIPSPLRRGESADVFHTALTVPTQASFTKPVEVSDTPTTEMEKSVEISPLPDEGGSTVSAPAESPLPQEEIQTPEGAEKEEPAVRGDEEARNKEEVRKRREARRSERAREMNQARSLDNPVEATVVDPLPWQENSAPEPERQPTSALDILPPMPITHSQPAIMIGISGCTGSGKTMLSHLLSWVLPPATPCFVLRQDDFFIPKHFLIPSKDGGLDADCRDAINFDALIRVMMYVKREAKMPPGFQTEQNEEYERDQAGALVSQEVLDEAKEILERSGLLSDGRPVCIVDGYLLYHEPRIREILDIKLLLRTAKETAKARRFVKPEYAGEQPEEDFWKTNEYFDSVSWPNYVEEHSPLFEDANVEGTPIDKLCRHLDIHVQPGLGMSAEETLRWAAERVADAKQPPIIAQSRDLDPEVVLGGRFEPCDCGSGCLGKFRRFLFEHV